MGRKSPWKLETDGIQLKNENHSYENLQNSQNHPIREEILSHKRDIWPMSSREYGTINQRKIILFSLFLLTLTLKEYEKAACSHLGPAEGQPVPAFSVGISSPPRPQGQSPGPVDSVSADSARACASSTRAVSQAGPSRCPQPCPWVGLGLELLGPG